MPDTLVRTNLPDPTNWPRARPVHHARRRARCAPRVGQSRAAGHQGARAFELDQLPRRRRHASCAHLGLHLRHGHHEYAGGDAHRSEARGVHRVEHEPWVDGWDQPDGWADDDNGGSKGKKAQKAPDEELGTYGPPVEGLVDVEYYVSEKNREMPFRVELAKHFLCGQKMLLQKKASS